MKTFKKAIAVLLTLVLVSSLFVCTAANDEKQYRKYDKVMLLGDSEASGFTDYGDEMSEFTRVDDSYAAYVADDLGASEFYPYACPGFRTVELRYMLDDTYRPDDKYLFTQVPRTPKDEIIAKTDAMRQAIKDSDLIMIGIGGNDWGAYLDWSTKDIKLENTLPAEFIEAFREYLKDATIEDDIIEQFIELANTFNAADELIEEIPKILEYGFSNLRANWEYIVEYIYENNPDVTLTVIGMFPTYFQTEEGAPDVVAEPDSVTKLIIDAVIAYGNKHMVEGQKKYGYLYVEAKDVVVEISHPTVAGHRRIADTILEALPDARFPYNDIAIGAAEYKAIEYMYLNGLMTGTDETSFNGDAKITKAEFSDILNKITGVYEVSDSNSEITKLQLTTTLYQISGKSSFTDFFNHVIGIMKMIFEGKAFTTVTRTEAAYEIYSIIK